MHLVGLDLPLWLGLLRLKVAALMLCFEHDCFGIDANDLWKDVNLQAFMYLLGLLNAFESQAINHKHLIQFYFPHKPLRKITVTLYNHQADSSLYVWPHV